MADETHDAIWIRLRASPGEEKFCLADETQPNDPHIWAVTLPFSLQSGPDYITFECLNGAWEGRLYRDGRITARLPGRSGYENLVSGALLREWRPYPYNRMTGGSHSRLYEE